MQQNTFLFPGKPGPGIHRTTKYGRGDGKSERTKVEPVLNSVVTFKAKDTARIGGRDFVRQWDMEGRHSRDGAKFRQCLPQAGRETADPKCTKLGMGMASAGVLAPIGIDGPWSSTVPAWVMLALVWGIVPAQPIIRVPVQHPFEDRHSANWGEIPVDGAG
jgi:hypothetical protein